MRRAGKQRLRVVYLEAKQLEPFRRTPAAIAIIVALILSPNPQCAPEGPFIMQMTNHGKHDQANQKLHCAAEYDQDFVSFSFMNQIARPRVAGKC